jgi:formate dehydrogenase maturation protein FdhE
MIKTALLMGDHMDIAGSPEVREARRMFEQAWRAKHPSTQPPALYPEHPEDPLWREADQMMDIALVQAYQNLASNTGYKAAVTAATWTAAPGYIGCPNNHGFAMSADYCPKCGAGPVPPGVRQQAEEGARRMGERAGLGLLRIGGIG